MGTSFAQFAVQRDVPLVFYDAQPEGGFLRAKLPGANVEFVQGDILDLPALLHAMTKHRVDTVVHTAGLIGNKVADAPYTGVSINVLGTINVLEAVRLAGVRRLVHISSLSVYDQRRDCPAPLCEDFPRGNGRLYDNTKAAKELMVEAYQRLYGFEVIALRLAKLYGLGNFHGGSSGGRLIQTLVQCALRGEVLTFEELVRAIRRVLPSLEVEVQPGPPPPLQVKQPLDLSRAREMLGWEPRYTMEAGFRDFVADLEEAGTRRLTPPGPL